MPNISPVDEFDLAYAPSDDGTIHDSNDDEGYGDLLAQVHFDQTGGSKQLPVHDPAFFVGKNEQNFYFS